MLSTALITGASTGIGAAYAERLAARGHDLVLVARDETRLNALAERLRSQFGRKVDVVVADLSDAAGLSKVAARLREDESIKLLVNNAGAAGQGGFADQEPESLERLIRLNVTAVTLLASAVVPRFLKDGGGSIINIASTVSLLPEIPMGVYAPTKSYVLAFSQNLQAELGSRGVYVQAVLPGATRTEIWERSGRDINSLQAVMGVEELVDAALAGYDRRELITIPSLADVQQWESFNAARLAMAPNLRNAHAAGRYTTRALTTGTIHTT